MGVDTCFNAGPSHYSATITDIDVSSFENVRFEWNQCSDGGLFKIYIWEDLGGFPGNDLFSELQLKLLKTKIPDIKKSHDGSRVIPNFILEKVKHLKE